MIKQFRSLHPINLILLIFMILILHLPVWEHAAGQTGVSAFQVLFKRLLIANPDQIFLNPVAQLGFGLLSVFIQALLFNKVLNDHNIIGKPSFMPALLFVVCSSFMDAATLLGPVLLCNFLIIWMLNQFFNIYRLQEIRSLLFDLGMVTAFGTIIYPPFAITFPLIWVGLTIFRTFNWREWLITLLGFATLFFFLAFYYYWNDALSQFSGIWMQKISANPNQNINFQVLVAWLIAGVLGLIQLRSNFFRSVVHIRKSYQLLLAFFVAAVISANLPLGVLTNHYLLAVVPVSVLMAYYFVHASKRWFYEALFLIMIGLIIYDQYF